MILSFKCIQPSVAKCKSNFFKKLALLLHRVKRKLTVFILMDRKFLVTLLLSVLHLFSSSCSSYFLYLFVSLYLLINLFSRGSTLLFLKKIENFFFTKVLFGITPTSSYYSA